MGGADESRTLKTISFKYKKTPMEWGEIYKAFRIFCKHCGKF